MFESGECEVGVGQSRNTGGVNVAIVDSSCIALCSAISIESEGRQRRLRPNTFHVSSKKVNHQKLFVTSQWMPM